MLLLLSAASTFAQSGLQVTYGNEGIQTISYNGVTLEDLGIYPADAFHIGHMKSTDLGGTVLASGPYTWGESNSGRTWNEATQTWTYKFPWGTISVHFVVSGNDLEMIVTTTNFAGSGIIFDGASIYPAELHFPHLPAGFPNTTDNQFSDDVSSPGVTLADYGAGEVAVISPSANLPLYTGFQPTGQGFTYTPILSGTSPASVAAIAPHHDRAVYPGYTDVFSVLLRFAPSGTSIGSLGSDAFSDWKRRYPATLNWTDRRAVGTVYLASTPASSSQVTNASASFKDNPRRWWNDPAVDVHSAFGLQQFQARMIAQAETNAANMRNLGAQGDITWSVEGNPFPEVTSHPCSPDQIAAIAPEMESVITAPRSPYRGMKLDDAYFLIMTSGGFRTGLCVRPQQFALNADGVATQVYLPESQVAQELIRKIGYSYQRWGITLFYIEGNVDSTGATLPDAILKQVAQAFPGVLLIPEQSTPLSYAYTAPWISFLARGTQGTDPAIYNYYPDAFSANLIGDVAASSLAASQAQITSHVHDGDMLLAQVDWWQPNDPTVEEIYAAAGPFLPPANGMPPTNAPAPSPQPPPTAPAPTPIPSPRPVPADPISAPPPATNAPEGAKNVAPAAALLAIVTPSPNTPISGQITVTGTTTLALDSAGTYLMVDGVEYGTQHVKAGPYSYPLDTTTLTNGPHVLQLWGHDTSNHTTLSTVLFVTVSN